MFFGALAGGAGAKLGGGNFWQGAVTGLFVAGMNHLAHSAGRDKFSDPPSKYKKFFSQKLNQANNLYNNKIEPALRSTFDTMETIGGTGEAIGLFGGLFTEGGSIVFAEPFAQLSLYGTLGNISLDVINLDFDSAVIRGIKFGASLGMGKAFEKLPYKNLVNMLNGFKSSTETYVVPVLEDSWNKFVAPPNKLKL